MRVECDDGKGGVRACVGILGWREKKSFSFCILEGEGMDWERCGSVGRVGEKVIEVCRFVDAVCEGFFTGF